MHYKIHYIDSVRILSEYCSINIFEQKKKEQYSLNSTEKNINLKRLKLLFT